MAHAVTGARIAPDAAGALVLAQQAPASRHAHAVPGAGAPGVACAAPNGAGGADAGAVVVVDLGETVHAALRRILPEPELGGRVAVAFACAGVPVVACPVALAWIAEGEGEGSATASNTQTRENMHRAPQSPHKSGRPHGQSPEEHQLSRQFHDRRTAMPRGGRPHRTPSECDPSTAQPAHGSPGATRLQISPSHDAHTPHRPKLVATQHTRFTPGPQFIEHSHPPHPIPLRSPLSNMTWTADGYKDCGWTKGDEASDSPLSKYCGKMRDKLLLVWGRGGGGTPRAAKV